MGKNAVICLHWFGFSISVLFLRRCGLFFWSMLLFGYTSFAQDHAPLTVRSVECIGNSILTTNRLLDDFETKKDGHLSEAMLQKDLGRILAHYQEQGYLHARIDSFRVQKDTIRQDAHITIFLTEGNPAVLRSYEMTGNEHFSAEQLRTNTQLHLGDTFIPSLFEQDIRTMLHLYEQDGYAFAKIILQNITFTDSPDEQSAALQISIDEGTPVRISEIHVEGNKTTKDNVLLREARIGTNELFRAELLERVKHRLDRMQLFSSVSLPELYMTDSGRAGLTLRVTEGSYNNFDGMIGYIPSRQPGESGTITGLARISLRNLFGTGRKLSARWFQENKDSRETEIQYFEPWIASYPVNLQFGFFQRKQDSTYVRLQYDIVADIMITGDVSAGVSFMQNNVYPAERYDRRKVIAENKTTSWGVSLRYDSRDDQITPTKGLLYSTQYQTGTKHTSAFESRTANSSTTRRILFDLAYYFSPFVRQVVCTELHLRDFSTAEMDISDLFRIGGATTLRGYREGFFLGSRIISTTLEYRYIAAPRSYFYGFLDFGYIVQPGFITANHAASEIRKVGYGVGVRMDSALGLIGVSFAFGEGDTFSTSKIHFRLINEF